MSDDIDHGALSEQADAREMYRQQLWEQRLLDSIESSISLASVGAVCAHCPRCLAPVRSAGPCDDCDNT